MALLSGYAKYSTLAAFVFELLDLRGDQRLSLDEMLLCAESVVVNDVLSNNVETEPSYIRGGYEKVIQRQRDIYTVC